MSRSEQEICVLVEFERQTCAHCGTVPRPVVFCRDSRKAVAIVESSKQLSTEYLIAAARCEEACSNTTRQMIEVDEETKGILRDVQ
jgi:hypothetical protein